MNKCIILWNWRHLYKQKIRIRFHKYFHIFYTMFAFLRDKKSKKLSNHWGAEVFFFQTADKARINLCSIIHSTLLLLSKIIQMHHFTNGITCRIIFHLNHQYVNVFLCEKCPRHLRSCKLFCVISFNSINQYFFWDFVTFVVAWYEILAIYFSEICHPVESVDEPSYVAFVRETSNVR